MEDYQFLEFHCQLLTRKLLSFEGESGLFIFDEIMYKQPNKCVNRQRNIV